MVFAQKPLLRHKLVKWFLSSSTVVFAIYLRPRAVYLRPCTFVRLYSTAELQDAMVVEYTNFRIVTLEMRRSGSRLFRSLTAKRSISVLMFWMSHGDPWPTLQILAKQVFSMVALSAASERNFSAFAFVHTKQRTVSARPPSKSWVTYEHTTFTKQQGVAAAFSNDDDITHSAADY